MNKQIFTKFQSQIYIIFETYCPASRNFMTSTLKSSYSPILKNHLEITFIPFGKVTKVSGPEKFNCQHGADECRLNQVMSCALYFLKEQEEQVKYVICSMEMQEEWKKVFLLHFLK